MLPWQHFCQGPLGQNFQFFIKNGLFPLKTYSYQFFQFKFEIGASKLTPVPNSSQIGQKIMDLKF